MKVARVLHLAPVKTAEGQFVEQVHDYRVEGGRLTTSNGLLEVEVKEATGGDCWTWASVAVFPPHRIVLAEIVNVSDAVAVAEAPEAV